MRVGIEILPEHRWWAAEPKWRAAEEYGFDHAWTFDHLGWRTLVDGPWFGAIPTLTAAAMVTTNLRLGTWVASPNFRHPVPFARELTAVDDVSDGRFILGVGAGGGGYDTTVMGTPPPRSRAARFSEFVELLDLLLRQDRTTWRGEYYEAVDARSYPGCVQKPRMPFVVAANGPKAMSVAARYGTGWATTGTDRETMDSWWASVAEVSKRFAAVAEESGRDLATVDRYLNLDAAPEYVLTSVEHFRDVLGRADALGFTDVTVPWPRHDGIFAGSEKLVEDIAAEVLPALR
ncbi:LLM class flavin-dependent oxidoreductase [Kibdelosporangium phytohabitans]|uniref:Luciferase n=1 Tax=Kibdelosporangium phytohabitans TaxID=860235 RepID=A0A0N9HRE9_9PSEU|nr:LLM class flavin-dependent oxidoreductase [Kibdelosporangium phytohabitans]ALG05683.1 luciferase [Kibdelosporangium phytohabitans]MBE1466335.1 alkanesulfonate monooxygenase SsuD/methylene tetrahydromethanopterin reductase-like flavin-dependent oxidoreductase (luciferase family) [Kibdelosporangium phytohabitans]